jgi:hypothetical protein
MYQVRESWTDERLDDFREEVNRRFDKLEERFESTHRLLLYAVIGIATLTLAGYAALATLIAVLA